MTRKTTRRSFLGTSAALGTAFWVGGQPITKASSSALQSLSAACVGVGGKGDSDSSHIADNDVQIVGICDVDKRMLEGAADMVATRQLSKKKPRTYSDYREMLKEKDLDLVLISGAMDPGATVDRLGVTWIRKPFDTEEVIEVVRVVRAKTRADK